MRFFSIIVPVYKTEKYLAECVDSVLNQTFTDFELILVDDGSPDNCPAICESYAKKDQRVRVIHKENGGLSSARNCGLNAASGKYILFLDSDDFYATSRDLEAVCDKLNGSKTEVLIFGQKKYFQLKSAYYDKPIFDIPPENKDALKFLMQSHIFVASACDKAYSREFVESNGLRFVEGQNSEDIEWCIKILLCKPAVSVLARRVYVYRRQNETSITANITERNITDIYRVIEKYMDADDIYVKHFLAVQYVQLLAITNIVGRDKIKDILVGLKKFYGLLDYGWYPYVAKARKFRFLGFSALRKLLGVKVYGLKGRKK